MFSPNANHDVYVEKSENTPVSFEIEDNEDQPLDFSTGNNFRESAVPHVNNGWPYTSQSRESPPSPIGPESSTQHRLQYMSAISPAIPKPPVRQSDIYMSPLSPATTKSPITKSWSNKSRTPESGVSTGSISPGRSSPVNLSPSYFSSSTRAGVISEKSHSSDQHPSEVSNVSYGLHEMPSVPIGLPIAPSSLVQPVNYINELSRTNYAILGQINNAIQNLNISSLSALHHPIINQNLMPVPQDQSDNSCTRNLQEKFHIPSSEMPTVNTFHFNNVFSFEQMQISTKANLQKFQHEIMLKKRDDNPSKSRRSAARTAPYRSNGRTDPRAFEEGGQDANGDSQGESVDMEVCHYLEKRRKNNQAAKKSRDQRKFKEEETAIKAAFYEQENYKLAQLIIELKLYIRLFMNSITPI